MRKVEVLPYNEEWALLFEQEANQISRILGEQLTAIHHIGSTSVPGLKAKPIIDLMPVVKDIALIDSYHAAMQGIGYEPRGELGIPGRRYFPKGGDDRTHHVHIFQVGSTHIERHLAFRDYLRVHPDTAKAYGELKQQLALQFPYDMDSYIAGKESFVLEIERKAMHWYQSKRHLELLG